jgi:hypothetical protein
MTITRLLLGLSVLVFAANLYLLIDVQGLIRHTIGEFRYLWMSLVCICGMYFISKQIALYGAKMIGRPIKFRR